MNNQSNSVQAVASEICFGLSRTTDEHSLAVFLQLFSREELLSVLIPRLEDQEILELVDTISLTMRKHLDEKEYHRLFLGDEGH